MYTHESYIKNRTSIRKAQKKYYEKNKSKFVSKYKDIRAKWDASHKAYLNEHTRLNKRIKALESKTSTYLSEAEKLLIAYANKSYLRTLHSRGLI